MEFPCIGGPLDGQKISAFTASFHAHADEPNCRLLCYRRHHYRRSAISNEEFVVYVFDELSEQERDRRVHEYFALPTQPRVDMTT